MYCDGPYSGFGNICYHGHLQELVYGMLDFPISGLEIWKVLSKISQWVAFSGGWRVPNDSISHSCLRSEEIEK
jgi:hypothetical protein